MKSRKEKEIEIFILKVKRRIYLSFKITVIRWLSITNNKIPEHQLLVFSDPRGGSTWLAEILKSIPSTALLWEPLHLNFVKQLNTLNFGWRQYIPDDFEWPDAKFFFEQVLSGKVINEWTISNSTLLEYVHAKYFIVKICRGNMLLPWLTNNFNFKFKPIYLVRHPFAVVNSQLKQGGWDQVSNKFKIPETPFNDNFLIHKDYLNSLKSREEILTAIWCISNNTPMSHPNNNKKWITIYYENLLIEPDKCMSKIFNIWGIPIPEGIEETYGKKSRTALKNTNIENPYNQLSRWERELTRHQIKNMQNVLDYFEFKTYSSKDQIPKET